jgi:hypothetical protein
LIRVESFPTRAALEERANELEHEGFEMKHLAFRGQEPWAVFADKHTTGGVVPATGIAVLHSDHVIPKALADQLEGLAKAEGDPEAKSISVTITQPSSAEIVSAVQQHISRAQRAARPQQSGKPNPRRR